MAQSERASPPARGIEWRQALGVLRLARYPREPKRGDRVLRRSRSDVAREEVRRTRQQVGRDVLAPSSDILECADRGAVGLDVQPPYSSARARQGARILDEDRRTDSRNQSPFRAVGWWRCSLSRHLLCRVRVSDFMSTDGAKTWSAKTMHRFFDGRIQCRFKTCFALLSGLGSEWSGLFTVTAGRNDWAEIGSLSIDAVRAALQPIAKNRSPIERFGACDLLVTDEGVFIAGNRQRWLEVLGRCPSCEAGNAAQAGRECGGRGALPTPSRRARRHLGWRPGRLSATCWRVAVGLARRVGRGAT